MKGEVVVFLNLHKNEVLSCGTCSRNLVGEFFFLFYKNLWHESVISHFLVHNSRDILAKIYRFVTIIY